MSAARGTQPLRRLPKDLLEYAQHTIMGRTSPKLPNRDRIDGGPKVTSTPQAMWWLFSERKDGHPLNKYQISRGLFGKIYWTPWKRPAGKLDIDACIEELIDVDRTNNSGHLSKSNSKKSSRPRRHNKVRSIISGGDLGRIAHINGSFEVYECPYQYVRQRLAEAVGLAYDDQEIDKIRREEIPSRIDNILSWLDQSTKRLDYSICDINRISAQVDVKKYARKRPIMSTYPVGIGDFAAKGDI